MGNIAKKSFIGFPFPVVTTPHRLKVSKRTDFPFGLNPIFRRPLFKCGDL